MKLNKITTLILMAAAIFCTSCVDDDLAGMDAQPKPTATTTVTSLTIAEGESAMIPFTISNAISLPSQFKIELDGGNGTQDDIDAGDQTTDGDTGIIGEGFEITVPAYATSFDIPVSALLDLDQTEDNETITLKITAAGVRSVITPVEYRVNVTIEDYKYCLWTLEATDTYGDGWNGASVTVTTDSGSVDYYNQDLDGVTGSETQLIDIPVGVGENYSIEFISGDWDGEVAYTLTAPDGTEYTAAGYPAVGVITSGTSTCN